MPAAVSHRTVTASDQPTHAEKMATLNGQDTGWDYYYQTPPVYHGNWSDSDILRWIGDNWFRKPNPN